MGDWTLALPYIGIRGYMYSLFETESIMAPEILFLAELTGLVFLTATHRVYWHSLWRMYRSAKD